jgi:hypothetical protein
MREPESCSWSRGAAAASRPIDCPHQSAFQRPYYKRKPIGGQQYSLEGKSKKAKGKSEKAAAS